MKKILMLGIFMLLFGFVGCHKPAPQPSRTAAEVKSDVSRTFELYNEGPHVSYAIEVKKNGEDISKFEHTLNLTPSGMAYTLDSLAAVYETDQGTLSCYVKDGKCYIDRFGVKSVGDVTQADIKSVLKDYSQAVYLEFPKRIVNDSFFNAFEVVAPEKGEEQPDNVIKGRLNLDAYQLPDDATDEEAEAFDSIKEKAEVKLIITYESLSKDQQTPPVVQKLEVLMTDANNITDSVIIEFRACPEADTPIAIEYPDLSSYQPE